MNRWTIRLSITMMLIIVILALSMRAKAQGEEIPILMLETRLPLIASEGADWRCLGPGPVIPPQETPGEMTCELVP